MADQAVTRPGGRTARIRAAALKATLGELIDHGYPGLTVYTVAARAGVDKTTLYRRWGGRDGLVADAVETFGTAHADVPDTGDTGEDLRRWARSIHTMLTDPIGGALVRAVFSAGDSPGMRHVRHRFWLGRATLVRPLVERAIARGDFPQGTDVDNVIRHVGAPLYYRLLVIDEPLTTADADLAAAATHAAAQAGVFVPRSRTTRRPPR
jgi:AcrR family transcriptional regulator